MISNKFLKALGVVATSAFILIFSTHAEALQISKPPAAVSFDWSLSAIYGLPHCESDADLDCISAVGILDSSNKFVNATWISDQMGRLQNKGLYFYQSGTSNWLIGTAATSRVITIGSLAYTPTFAQKTGLPSKLEIHPTKDLLFKEKLSITVRSSWIEPLDYSLNAEESNFVQKKLPTGYSFTFSGKPYTESRYSNLVKGLASDANADFDLDYFQFSVLHKTPGSDTLFEGCPRAEFNISTNLALGRRYSSADGSWTTFASSPTYSGGLIFEFAQPKATVAGKPTSGFLQFQASKGWLTCKFPGNTLLSANDLEIKLTDKNGVNQPVSATISKTANELNFYIHDLNITSGSIGIAIAPPKKTNIICVNIKKPTLTKKITAVAPKCPAGYKKK